MSSCLPSSLLSYLPPSTHFHPNPSHSSLKQMAATTNSLQSLHHHHSLLKCHVTDTPPPSTLSSSLFLNPTTTTSLSHSISSSATFSTSPATSSSTPSTSQAISFDVLQDHLANKKFRQADEETRRLLIVLAGESAQKRGYVFFSEVQFIPEADLRTIDDLWKQHSNNKFGYSVQKRIFEKAERDFSKFFLKVGWMKKLDTEIEQYNYRAFPTEFVWELADDTPEGHLPLTNALRGTQLLNSIFNHPAFAAMQGEDKEDDKLVEEINSIDNGGLNGSKPLSKTLTRPDYSF
ncbi:tetrapyrrole-binding protein, chloroplastic [Corylus avellana]|uniref:tetrapyrrole-binding protein, chloroplastic n=1 Tax=Corylus avellana TaxID=13451 RepID=UPI00286BA204|nr:tetrapyrrole-binding protein, chloroplastic [Corylus avellana]